VASKQATAKAAAMACPFLMRFGRASDSDGSVSGDQPEHA
jgi:hypothetical protein